MIVNLLDFNRLLLTSGQNEQYGILIFDSINKEYDEKIRTKVSSFLKFGTHYNKTNYLIEDVLFTYSHWRNLCQISDCVLYIINAYNRDKQKINPKRLELIEECYKLIEHKIVRGPFNNIGHSIKIFP